MIEDEKIIFAILVFLFALIVIFVIVGMPL